MNLTNEEKKEIGDAASAMMQTFCEFRLAEDRLNTANTLSGNLAQIRIPDEIMKNALSPYAESFKNAQEKFFDVLGIPLSNKEFWGWYKNQPPSMEQLKRKYKEVLG